MKPMRFDPLFTLLTLGVASYVVYDGHRGGDPTIVMLCYILTTAAVMVLDLLTRLFRRFVPNRRGVRVR